MPDIVRLRYVGAGPVSVPVLGREVKPEELVEIPGRVLTEVIPDGADKPVPVPEDADYILIESGNPAQRRAWPKSLWRNETVTARAKSKE